MDQRVFKPSGQRMRRDLSGKIEAKRKKCGRDKERNDEPLSKLCEVLPKSFPVAAEARTALGFL